MLAGRLVLSFGAKLNLSHGPFGALEDACNALNSKATSGASIFANSQAGYEV